MGFCSGVNEGGKGDGGWEMGGGWGVFWLIGFWMARRIWWSRYDVLNIRRRERYVPSFTRLGLCCVRSRFLRFVL